MDDMQMEITCSNYLTVCLFHGVYRKVRLYGLILVFPDYKLCILRSTSGQVHLFAYNGFALAHGAEPMILGLGLELLRQQANFIGLGTFGYLKFQQHLSVLHGYNLASSHQPLKWVRIGKLSLSPNGRSLDSPVSLERSFSMDRRRISCCLLRLPSYPKGSAWPRLSMQALQF